jgi:hypothetical protein
VGQRLELKITGLKTNPSQFGAKEGALKVAKNIVVDRPNTAGSRRGFTTYGYDLDETGSGSFENFYNYNSTLLIKYGDTFYKDTGSIGDWDSFAGAYTAPDSELGTRSVQNNGSFFFTTNAGLYKLESLTATPELAGIPRAIGMDLALSGDSGFFTAETQVAYRVVWGKKDANGVVSLGYPSERGEIANVSSQTGEYTDTTDVQLTVYIPAGITTDYFFQVYRSGFSANETTVANDELQLVYENNPTAAEIAAGSITFIDNAPDSLRGATIYTAPSQEGILQANELPPLANDVTMYKNYCLFANTRTRHFFNLTLLSVGGSDGLQIGDIITIGGVNFTAAVAQNHAAGEFLLDTSGTAAENIANTAKSLVQVINRYATNTVTYGYYTSGFDELPGQMLIRRRDLTDTVFAVTYDAVETGADDGIMFNPVLSQTARNSSNEAKSNRIYVSKLQQVDAVPTLQYFDAGQQDSGIKRIISLRDSAWALKDNGEIYRLVGETVNDFQLLKFDSTTNLIGSRTAVVFNNQIFCFTEQGIVAISDSGVAVKSWDIEDQIKTYFSSSTFPTVALGVSYESERKYLLHTGVETFCYNSFTNAWTKWDVIAEAGFVNPTDDKLYWGKSDGFVYQERKNFDKFDYADRAYDTWVWGSSGTTVNISSDTQATIGMTLRQNSTSSYISAVSNWPVDYVNGDDGNLNNPVDYDTVANYVPGSNARIYIGDDRWNASEPAGSTDIWAFGVGDTSPAGQIRFVRGTIQLPLNWVTFGPSSDNGLKTFTLPKSGDGTTDGGYFQYYFHSGAWGYAFTGNSSFIIIAQNGSVYKGSISENNLVVTYDGKTGPAGGIGPDIGADTGNYYDVTVEDSLTWIVSTATLNDFIDCELQWLEIYGDNPGYVKRWKELTVFFRDMNDKFKVISTNNFNSVEPVTTEITPTFINSQWGSGEWGGGPWGGLSEANQENRTYFPIQFMRAIWQNIKIETNRAFTNFTLNAVSIIYEKMDTEFNKVSTNT